MQVVRGEDGIGDHAAAERDDRGGGGGCDELADGRRLEFAEPRLAYFLVERADGLARVGLDQGVGVEERQTEGFREGLSEAGLAAVLDAAEHDAPAELGVQDADALPRTADREDRAVESFGVVREFGRDGPADPVEDDVFASRAAHGHARLELAFGDSDRRLHAAHEGREQDRVGGVDPGAVRVERVERGRIVR